jgi:hypothetical protein
MIPFIVPGAQICQLDQRGYASQKDSIVSATGTDVVALPPIGEGCHVKVLFSLRPIVAPVHGVLVASDPLEVKVYNDGVRRGLLQIHLLDRQRTMTEHVTGTWPGEAAVYNAKNKTNFGARRICCVLKCIFVVIKKGFPVMKKAFSLTENLFLITQKGFDTSQQTSFACRQG